MPRRVRTARGRACITMHAPKKMETLVDEKVWLGIYNKGNKRKR